jgi:acyl carrier protein
MDRETALGVVVSCLREALEQFGGPAADIGEETVIVGPAAVLDSIGVVSLIVDIEQKLEMEHDISITLASEKAMSQRSSPFRSAGVLADHVIATISEGQAA